MIIGFDAKRYFNNATGLGFYSRTLLDGLRRFHPEHQYLLYTPYTGNFGRPDDEARLPNSFLGRKFHPVWRSHGVAPQLARDGVEIFHGLSHELPSGLSRHSIRSVVTMHDLIFVRYPELYSATDRFFYETKYRRACRQADHIVAVSEQTRRDLEELFDVPPEKISVIGQSCDPAFVRANLNDTPLSPNAPPSGVLAVGSLTPRKNWHGLLTAMALLRDQFGVETTLTAVGSGGGPYAEALLVQQRQLGLQVRWINRHVPSDELAQYYRSAEVVAYPSVFEGFGIPLLEAISVGVPVVTTQGGCFEEVGGAAALYTDPNRPESIAESLFSVLTDTELRRQMKAAMPAQAAKFSLPQICGQWIDTYTTLLQR